ncbi:hypothetical protein [Mycobacterium sp. Aquia_213]|nr:hypothetical protein [Mycobacterium sp. Aquia_213]WAC92657.1 hypothetical protein LMQ14_05690 [Mycobacterium sp. Aquia_213]
MSLVTMRPGYRAALACTPSADGFLSSSRTAAAVPVDSSAGSK